MMYLDVSPSACETFLSYFFFLLVLFSVFFSASSINPSQEPHNHDGDIESDPRVKLTLGSCRIPPRSFSRCTCLAGQYTSTLCVVPDQNALCEKCTHPIFMHTGYKG